MKRRNYKFRKYAGDLSGIYGMQDITYNEEEPRYASHTAHGKGLKQHCYPTGLTSPIFPG